ncbi:thiamine ABC transporter substrate-binding protein [Enteractinococcus coprophilus]|uniref:Thiamine transport system substrate-binding protein n=1 Tax=Enteractinococcus coprophilus TaxID=1027633 RepID=A0A543AMI1_9MICC|nr:thiamine ABC transporter substrate-binding protein [Enteractinococcus coprophilus]TQL73745.1 thiamine transport system substrate-binding protein [Enteractinococcus coprophilus]
MKKSLPFIVAVALGLTGCSVADQAQNTDDGAAGSVTIMTHDSFNVPEELVAAFEEDTGYTVTTTSPGDAGAVLNQLILQKDNPTVDAVYGIDNYSAESLLAEDMLTTHDADLGSAEAFALASDDDNHLAPIDHGQVCINMDNEWFEAEDLTPPETLEDLTEPDYKGLLVTTDPTTSSPGLAFLIATIAGTDDWQAYWQDLLDNGTKVAGGWSDAYYSDFTATGEGDYPLVVSYSSSPSAEEGRTSSILGTCTEQVEYAGVLAAAENPDGAQAFIEFLLSEDFQETLPTEMYMYPVREEVELPEEWASYAELSDEPITADLNEVTENRDTWLNEWTELTENHAG